MGLVLYLTEESNNKLHAKLGKLAAPGSFYILDVMSKGYLTTPQLKPFLDFWQQNGSPHIWGHSEPEKYFAEFGWTNVKVITVSRQYDRILTLTVVWR
jgi:O-methyltransferase involved in polyketide biosynthesis